MMQDQLYRQLKEIHQSKHKHDTLLSELQRATDRLTKKELSHEQLKKQQTAITSLYGQVKAACHKNSETLMEIKVQLMKLRSHERLDVNRQEAMCEDLVDYFSKLQQNAKRSYSVTSERLDQLQKVRLMTNGNNPYDVSDETGLINSNRTAGEAVSISREIKGSLEYQQSRLDSIGGKLSNFFGQLNLSKTITRMVANRSKQDYRLILLLTALLILEVLVCYFYVRPWLRS